MTARKYLREQRQRLEIELAGAGWMRTVVIFALLDQLDEFKALVDARSDKSARTAEDHTA